MLTAIASLAEDNSSSVSSLVDRVSAKDCLCLIFKRSGMHSFLRCELSSNNGEETYLYHKDPSGKPGLFLSWTISAQGQGSVRQFQQLIKTDTPTIQDTAKLNDFWEKKFVWFSKLKDQTLVSRNKVINDKILLETLDEGSRSLLLDVCNSYAKSLPRIRTEATKILREYEFSKEPGVRSNKLLVTIALEGENGKIEYPKDFQPFVRLFARAVSGDASLSEANFICTVCNSPSAGEIHIPSPLEFLTQDQLIYIPNGDPRNKAHAIALCQNCSDALRSGQAFINSHLSFKILGSRLFFWLVPILPNAVKSNYLNALSERNGPLYLNQLRDLCGGMEAAVEQSYGVQDVSEVDSWLTYLAVFCFKDTQGHTRVTGVSEGIYPSRLRKLSDASSAVQRRYPYFLCDPKIMFSFPLLTRFFERESGESTIVNVMESLFTENIINPSYTVSAIVEKVKSEGITRARKKGNASMRINQKMRAFVNIALQAMIIAEYLIETDVLRIGGGNLMSLTDNSLRDKYVDVLRKYINSHKLVDQNSTVRSVFLVGVAVGILLEVQMKEFKSYPFWKHLNRLELDLIKVANLYAPVKAHLMNYRKGNAKDEISSLRNLVEYIGQNLNFETQNVDRDITDLVFSIGLSEGYLIYHNVGVEQRNE